MTVFRFYRQGLVVRNPICVLYTRVAPCAIRKLLIFVLPHKSVRVECSFIFQNLLRRLLHSKVFKLLARRKFFERHGVFLGFV